MIDFEFVQNETERLKGLSPADLADAYRGLQTRYNDLQAARIASRKHYKTDEELTLESLLRRAEQVIIDCYVGAYS